MARTRMPDTLQLMSWADADNALRQIAEGEIRIAEIEGKMNIEINEIKDRADKQCAPIRAAIDTLGKQLKEFAEMNRPDFGKVKSKKLTFGTLGWRASRSISIKKALTDKIIENLRRLGMGDCVKTTETINKDILETYSKEQIVAAGATLNEKNTFWYETDKETLQNQPNAG